MIYLLVLGLIAIGGGLFFVYVNSSKKTKTEQKKNGNQKITKEGKVIYLFDKDEGNNEENGNEEDDD